jgi:SsrA-binding protein
MAHIDLETRRERKLLLKRAELKKIERRSKEKGYTIIPYKIYFNERGIIKLQIALAQGKKVYDKRQSIKEKDNKRDLERIKRGKY